MLPPINTGSALLAMLQENTRLSANIGENLSNTIRSTGQGIKESLRGVEDSFDRARQREVAEEALSYDKTLRPVREEAMHLANKHTQSDINLRNANAWQTNESTKRFVKENTDLDKMQAAKERAHYRGEEFDPNSVYYNYTPTLADKKARQAKRSAISKQSANTNLEKQSGARALVQQVPTIPTLDLSSKDTLSTSIK